MFPSQQTNFSLGVSFCASRLVGHHPESTNSPLTLNLLHPEAQDNLPEAKTYAAMHEILASAVTTGLCWDNGKSNGNYNLGCRVKGLDKAVAAIYLTKRGNYEAGLGDQGAGQLDGPWFRKCPLLALELIRIPFLFGNFSARKAWRRF